MRYSYTIISFAVAALALPTRPVPDDGSWAPGKYEGPGTGFDDGKYDPSKYGQKRTEGSNALGTEDSHFSRSDHQIRDDSGPDDDDAGCSREVVAGFIAGDCVIEDLDGKWADRKRDDDALERFRAFMDHMLGHSKDKRDDSLPHPDTAYFDNTPYDDDASSPDYYLNQPLFPWRRGSDDGEHAADVNGQPTESGPRKRAFGFFADLSKASADVLPKRRTLGDCLNGDEPTDHDVNILSPKEAWDCLTSGNRCEDGANKPQAHILGLNFGAVGK
ncbi:LOW QUALITY PROTEIN: hypothetical protein NLU13_5747 [Sarocladium strictum]|uniref:Uncharacterized protein n=1 Tax=Sarocladium strictum TaxID=5046 RepID=A0AA39GHI0_SARSR|nr:LOW QUALITY PROTEIN: hypothetical protein NLU13_5747 [Sarocladium strictum]